jgi:hypothetical protein
MTQEKKDAFDEENNEISDQYLVCYIGPDGNITWVMSDNLTSNQHALFNILNITLVNPSLVLRIVMSIELLFTELLFFLFKKRNQGE